MMSSKQSGKQLSKRIAHARAFQLEHADRLAATEQVVARFVVERELRKLQLGAALVHQLLAERQHGERRQSQKIELDQAGFLDVLHVELGDRHGGSRVAVERHQLVERAVADHHAGGMGRGVARQAFEPLGDVDQLADLLVLVGRFLQPRLQEERLLERRRIGGVEGDELRDLVDLEERHAQRAAGIAQHGTCLQLSEGDDRRDLLGAVFVTDIADHLVPAILAEVDVEVGHRHALGIEEALEQKAEAQRIEVGDFEGPGDHRARAGTTPRPDRNALGFRIFDEVGNDQEVAFIFHAKDDIHLVSEPLAIDRPLLLRFFERIHTTFEPRLALRAQLGRLVPPARGIERRQDRIMGADHEGAALGDHHAVGDRLGQVRKKLGHLVRSLQAMLGRDPFPIAHADLHPLLDAKQDVMGLVFVRLQKMDVVGRDQRQIILVGKLDHRRLDLILLDQTVAHDLDIEAPGKGFGQPLDDRLRLLAIALRQRPADRAFEATGKKDQVASMTQQIVERDLGRQTRFGFQMRQAQELQEIAIAVFVLGIDRHP